jgi:amino acid transporter
MSFSFCFSCVGVVTSATVVFDYGLSTGGPAVMAWGWLIGSFFTICVGLSLAEICSTYPSAGSVYYWAGALAPKRWAPISAYVCGTFNFLAALTGCASFAYGLSKIIAGIVNVSTGNAYSMSSHYTVFISIMILGLWSLKNIMRIDNIGWINNFSAVY